MIESPGRGLAVPGPNGSLPSGKRRQAAEVNRAETTAATYTVLALWSTGTLMEVEELQQECLQTSHTSQRQRLN